MHSLTILFSFLKEEYLAKKKGLWKRMSLPKTRKKYSQEELLNSSQEAFTFLSSYNRKLTYLKVKEFAVSPVENINTTI